MTPLVLSPPSANNIPDDFNILVNAINALAANSGGGSGFSRVINSISTATTGAAAANTDYIYLCNGTFTYTQPTAVSNTNEYVIKNVSSGIITITGTSSQTFDGATSVVLTTNQSVHLISNNTNWNIE